MGAVAYFCLFLLPFLRRYNFYYDIWNEEGTRMLSPRWERVIDSYNGTMVLSVVCIPFFPCLPAAKVAPCSVALSLGERSKSVRGWHWMKKKWGPLSVQPKPKLESESALKQFYSCASTLSLGKWEPPILVQKEQHEMRRMSLRSVDECCQEKESWC